MRDSRVCFTAPLEAVYDYLSDPVNRPEWQSSLRAVEVLTPGPVRVGTAWIDRTVPGPAPRMEITAMAPPATTSGGIGVWTEVGRWRGLGATLALTFTPVPEGSTDVGFRLTVTGTGAWWPVARVLRLLAPPAVRGDLRRAARILAARPV